MAQANAKPHRKRDPGRAIAPESTGRMCEGRARIDRILRFGSRFHVHLDCGCGRWVNGDNVEA